MLAKNRYRTSPEVITQIKPDQVSVTFIKEDDNRLFIFTGSAPLIWKHLDNGTQLEDLRVLLKSEWPQMNDTDWKEVVQFIEKLVSLDLLVVE